MTAPWTDGTVRRVAQDIREELGNWMLGEIGDAGLTDAIWEAYEPFQQMTVNEQTAFQEAVSKEIYG